MIVGHTRRQRELAKDVDDANEIGMSPENRRILRHRLNKGPTATFTETNHNRKLSPVTFIERPGQRPQIRARRPYVCSTFAAIGATCPDSCQYKRDADGPKGCFADAGITGIKSRELNRAARDLTGEHVISEECREIDRAFGGRQVPQDGPRGGGRALRLHVGGDVPSVHAARALGIAAARWRARGGGRVWTYTHNWRAIPRAAFGAYIHVLASVDHPEELEDARAAGYPPAIVVPEHPKDGKTWRFGPWRVIPCPAETRKTNCADCGLCLGGVNLYKMRAVIAFEVHGGNSAEALVQLGAPPRGPQEQPNKRGPKTCSVCGGQGHNARRHHGKAPRR